MTTEISSWPRAVFGLAAIALLATLTTGPARAQAVEDVDTIIAQARIAEQELEYEKATSLWLRIILRSDATSEQLINANLNAGRLARLLEREDEARAHFLYVLKHDPERQLPPNDPPRLREYFEQLREKVRQQQTSVQQTAVATSSVPTPTPASSAAASTTTGEPEELPIMLVGGGAAAALGALGLGLGSVMGILSSEANQQAEASEVQVERGAHFTDRDLFATVANVGFAGGGVLLLAGAGIAGYALFAEGE